MGRRPCCSKEGLNRGAWTASEDTKLTDYINLHGEGKWRSLPQRAGLKRCGKSCRLRWLNYLRPDIKRGNISPDEEELIMRLHKLLGNRWSLIAGRLPGRTDNEIKNYWNTNLGKKVHNSSQKISIDDEKNKKYNNSSNVIRTKAMKCSRVIFHPQPHQIGPIDHDKVVRKKTEAKEISIHNSLELSFIPEEHNSMELILNADNTRDVCLSDLLNYDFTGLLDGINDSAIDLSRPSSDGSLIFSEESMEHWADQNYNFLHQNVASNHEGFASFIEPDADWLA